jgi:hypothetical protein
VALEAPARPARPSSQTGRRRAGVRPAMPGDGVPALRRPGPEAWPVLACACGGDDLVAGGAGGRAWGRWGTPGGVLHPARAPVPHPASRTPRPSGQPRAPSRGASASSGGLWSSGGTCVRQTTFGVGRNSQRAEIRATNGTNLALERRLGPRFSASDLASGAAERVSTRRREGSRAARERGRGRPGETVWRPARRSGGRRDGLAAGETVWRPARGSRRPGETGRRAT